MKKIEDDRRMQARLEYNRQKEQLLREYERERNAIERQRNAKEEYEAAQKKAAEEAAFLEHKNWMAEKLR